jgi:hypothetical protein
MEATGQLHTLATFPSGTNWIEDWMDPRPQHNQVKKLPVPFLEHPNSYQLLTHAVLNNKAMAYRGSCSHHHGCQSTAAASCPHMKPQQTVLGHLEALQGTQTITTKFCWYIQHGYCEHDVPRTLMLYTISSFPCSFSTAHE